MNELSTVSRPAPGNLRLIPRRRLHDTERIPPRHVFRREGEYWSIQCKGELFRLKDSKGLRYHEQLLRHPGRLFLASELVTAENDPEVQPSICFQGGEARSIFIHSVNGLGDAGEILDPKAKLDYKRRLVDLRSELDEARTFNDTGRTARLQHEVDFILQQLAGGFDVRGYGRRAASSLERARQSVTHAIRATIRRIAAHDEALGGHFDATIKTGNFCSYVPDPLAEVLWDF